MFSPDDTIVAIATPPGRGGLGVVRLAGPDAPRIAQTLIGRDRPFQPRHATFARVTVPAGQSDAEPIADEVVRAVDQVVVTWFARPHSYTGDDVVEISGHGSPLLLDEIVRLSMRAGARLAQPGEFTLRAYLNGRLDLVQAEAVADLVDAVTPVQARAAMDQLEGTLTAALGRLDAALFDLSARLEASLDFPEEGFHFITRDQALADLSRLHADMSALSEHGRAGRVVREGRLVAIVGRPNAGKSSLFNALVGSARAIVTDVPGTTRDMVTEVVDIEGVPVTLVDTAGIRDGGDPIETEGVRRAMDARRVAALTIVVIDGSTPLGQEDFDLAQDASVARLVVASKTDLPRRWCHEELQMNGRGVVDLSTVTGAGLVALRRGIAQSLGAAEALRDTPSISNARHLALLDDAMSAVRSAELALRDGASEEMVLADLSAARRPLEEITGARTAEDVLRHIFGRFCVGK
jgi:tRNA modification GTPase